MHKMYQNHPLTKLVASLLVLALVISLLPIRTHADDSQDNYITDLLLAQQSEYPEGDVCTDSTEKYHIQILCPGLLLNCQSCWGYCFRLLTSAYNLDPKKSMSLTWQNINGHLSGRPSFEDAYSSPADIRPGDILAWPGHATVVLENKHDQEKLVLAEGNYGGRVHYGREVSYSQVTSRVSYIVRYASSQIPGNDENSTNGQTLRFKDVPEDKYYYKAVLWAAENNVTSGTSEHEFSPDKECTREQVMAFLWRASGGQEPTIQQTPFVDVRDTKYYWAPIRWALERGFTAGTSSVTFGVGQTCTRAQIVTFLWRLSDSPEPKSTCNPFCDVEEGKYYYKAVLWAVQNGITCGKDQTHFKPGDVCTRAEVVTFIYKCFGNNS